MHDNRQWRLLMTEGCGIKLLGDIDLNVPSSGRALSLRVRWSDVFCGS